MKNTLFSLFMVFIFAGCTKPPLPQVQKPCVNIEKLNTYGFNHLEQVANALREEKQNNKPFEISMFLLNKTVAEYADIFKSSVHISNVARFIPIPYAGEVCSTTKLISKAALSLGDTANAFNQYKQSSNTFLEEFEKLNPTVATSAEISKLAIYGDTKLLADARNLELSLQEISSTTATMVSVMQKISETLEKANGYVGNMRNYVGLNSEASVDDEAKVVKSRSSMLTVLMQLNQKIALLKKSGQMYRYNIAKARVFSELSLELGK